MRPSWLSAVRWIVPALLLCASGWSTVLFSETGNPDANWSDDGDVNDWMIGFTEQDVINAGWGGTEAEAGWLLDPWHSPGNRVIAVGLLTLSPDTKDAEDSLTSSLWRDTIRRPDVAWTLFCNVAFLYELETGSIETVRVDLKAQDQIVDSLRVEVSGTGFSGWLFMAGSMHEPMAETGMNQWEIQASVAGLSGARSVAVMVDDISVYESEEIEFIAGRPPDSSATPAIGLAAILGPVPLPSISLDPSGNVLLTWRSLEGQTYDVERKETRGFGGGTWRKIAENLPHNASGVVTFSDVGAGWILDVAYYRVRVYPP
ncbi:MAG: hypothetical protein Q8Q12_11980 [bacterium]|nr:hypothetical protein [bacterium]